MARTMAGGQRKAVGAKAPRKSMGCSSSSSSSSSARVSSVASPGRAGKAKSRASGGNAPTHWDTPKWQKGIASFFKKKDVETKVTGLESDSGAEEGDGQCSQTSVHTLDLNEAPGTILSIFDSEEDGPSSSRVSSGSSSGSSSGTSSTGDDEQPGPSNYKVYH
ncbi:hypothetical protein ACHWQZ_G002893 [Mnemiopsis leidyi]